MSNWKKEKIYQKIKSIKMNCNKAQVVLLTKITKIKNKYQKILQKDYQILIVCYIHFMRLYKKLL